jgi:hypothetical protein
LEIAGGWFHLDGFLFDEFVSQIRVPEMTDGFIASEKDGFFELAENERGVRLGGFEDGAHARFFSEQDLGDVEERIDAGDLLDFFDDEANGLNIWSDGDAHAGSRWGLFVRCRGAPAIFKWAATALGWATVSVISGAAVAIIAAGWAVFSPSGRIGLALFLVAACPCRS